MALRAALGLLTLYLIAFDAVAWAMALAPNAASPSSAIVPIPDALRGRRLLRHSVEVGPPSARLDLGSLEPEAWVRGNVVLLHGIRMDRRSLAPMAADLVDAGYRVVAPDLRGHGASSGRYLTYGEVEARDLSQLLDALSAERAWREPVGLFGFSYGAAVALEASAIDPRVRAVVAVAPFASLREVVGDYRAKYLPGPLQLLPPSWFQSALDDAAQIAAFDPDTAGPARSIARSNARILLLHGDRDTQIPARHSQALWKMAGARAELSLVPGRTHDDVLADPRVRAQALAFFERRLGAN